MDDAHTNSGSEKLELSAPAEQPENPAAPELKAPLPEPDAFARLMCETYGHRGAVVLTMGPTVANFGHFGLSTMELRHLLNIGVFETFNIDRRDFEAQQRALQAAAEAQAAAAAQAADPELEKPGGLDGAPAPEHDPEVQ